MQKEAKSYCSLLEKLLSLQRQKEQRPRDEVYLLTIQ